MKKLLLFVILLILSQCQISVGTKEASAQDRIASSSYLKADSYIHQADGMTYRVFIGHLHANSVDIEVINVTKEKLEVEKLKLEIKHLKYTVKQ